MKKYTLCVICATKKSKKYRLWKTCINKHIIKKVSYVGLDLGSNNEDITGTYDIIFSEFCPISNINSNRYKEHNINDTNESRISYILQVVYKNLNIGGYLVIINNLFSRLPFYPNWCKYKIGNMLQQKHTFYMDIIKPINTKNNTEYYYTAYNKIDNVVLVGGYIDYKIIKHQYLIM